MLLLQLGESISLLDSLHLSLFCSDTNLPRSLGLNVPLLPCSFSHVEFAQLVCSPTCDVPLLEVSQMGFSSVPMSNKPLEFCCNSLCEEFSFVVESIVFVPHNISFFCSFCLNF